MTNVYASLPSGFLIRGRAAAGGGYEVAGLPPGRATVHVEVRAGLTEFVGEEEVEAGGTADVRLRSR